MMKIIFEGELHDAIKKAASKNCIRRKHYNITPQRGYNRKYCQTPEVKQRRRDYQERPEVKKRMRKYNPK